MLKLFSIVLKIERKGKREREGGEKKEKIENFIIEGERFVLGIYCLFFIIRCVLRVRGDLLLCGFSLFLENVLRLFN